MVGSRRISLQMNGQIADCAANAAAFSVPGTLSGRHWTFGLLLFAAIAVPLVFDPALGDTFALPKFATLYVLVTLALAGPLVDVSARSWATPGRGRLRWVDGLPLLLALLGILATALSFDPAHAVLGEPLQYQGLLAWLLCIASYGLARFLMSGARTRAPSVLTGVFTATAVAGALIAGYALIQQVGLDPFWHVLDKGRVFSTLGQANALAAYLVLALPVAAALSVRSSGLMRWLAAAGVALMAGALVLTYSRGGYLGLLAAAGCLALLVVPGTRIERPCVAKAGLAVALASSLVLAVPALRDVATRALARAGSIGNLQETSIEDHLDLWAVGAQIAIDHPLLGTGPDAYVLVFPAYRLDTLPAAEASRMARFRPESPHNVYLAIASGLGLPALVAYLALILTVISGLVRAVRREAVDRVLGAALVAALVGHVVTDLFMTGDVTGSWIFWVLLGVAVVLPPGNPVTGTPRKLPWRRHTRTA
jgi:putative inorganic carbon (HCO3(-)) transporter